jgi:hydroxymethylpyrimidine pyrophosphatase-like HAD family hydrolase
MLNDQFQAAATAPLATEAPGGSGLTGVPSETGSGASTAVSNLLNDTTALARLLVTAMRGKSWLDAYLLAAGMAQIADDQLHPELHPLDSAGDILADHPHSVGPATGRVAARIASAARQTVPAWPGSRRALRWSRDIAALVDRLADAVAGRPPSVAQHAQLVRVSSAIARDLDQLPTRFRRDVVRLPACFHGLDQEPSDLARLVAGFAERWPDRARPLLVVGVRTSGSYLAPLHAAFLRAAGYENARVLTVRPGRGLLRHERSLVRSLAERGGLALVSDDPPVTGASIARSADQLQSAGLSADAVVLLLQVFAGESLPAALHRFHTVLLPWNLWAVNQKLKPERVERIAADLMGSDSSVVSATPVQLPKPRPARGHARARYRLRVRDAAGAERDEEIVVEGVGLGYLGDPAHAAATAFAPYGPRVLGLENGLLYREWLPDERRLGALQPADEGLVATAIAAYVAERHRAFPVADDASLRFHERPAWDVAGSIMSTVFGRLWPVAKFLFTDRIAKLLLQVEEPSVVDGNTDLARWFYPNGSRESLVKVDVGDHLYSNLGLRCFDAAFDLAGVTAQAGTPSLTRQLRRAYSDLGHEEVDEERWLLYELAHLWGRQRTQPEREPELRGARARALQRYFAEVYFGNAAAPPEGPLCALDVDGVLETEHLGFPALSPAAALALRALMLHGFRPVLVTGRGLDEVVERCQAYGLAGGVAEYGAAIYESRAGRASGLVSGAGEVALERVRIRLESLAGVELDRSHSLAVRAFNIVAGRRVGLPPEAVIAALAAAEGIDAIKGEGQTDFVLDGIDKGTGLRELIARLTGCGSEGAEPETVALAVGDTPADLPMAPLAKMAFAPAHADAALADAGYEITSRPYQAGLAEAVGRLIGHAPGGCDACRMPLPSPERRILLTALAAQERGRRGIPLAALKLAARISAAG